MKIGIPQMIYIVLDLLGLGIILAKHGERKDGHYNFWFRLLSTTITFMILYSGGFFS